MEFVKATVAKLSITQPFEQVPHTVEKLELLLDGIKHDKHFGKTRNADVRTIKLLPKGIEIANLRMVTIVSQEELKEISEEVGAEILSDDLEANIMISGIENLTNLPVGTIMKFPKSAILFVTAENLPCVIPAQNMIKRGVDKMKAIKFSKCALGKRGLTALVYASGVIKLGDDVEIYSPQSFE